MTGARKEKQKWQLEKKIDFGEGKWCKIKSKWLKLSKEPLKMKYQQQSVPVINARCDGKSITFISETFEGRNQRDGTPLLRFFTWIPGRDFPG